MRYTLLTICVCFIYTNAIAQAKADTVTSLQMGRTTIDSAFHLPAGYFIVDYKACFYAGKLGIAHHYPGSAISYNYELYHKITRGRAGDILSFTDVIVMKDGRRLKWAEKTFVFR
ncbi:MAG: hypothetical protein JWO03_2446 [Bacteroidetes bacterium]|nr:hypothetical protein [Bacteroidota bacterium]